MLKLSKLRIIKPVAILIALVSLLQCSSRNISEEISEKPLFNTEYSCKQFDFEGHRGARGLAPENTMPAFKKALEYNVDTLELDLHVTKDKKLVIHHDHRINSDHCRFPDNRSVPDKRIREWNLSELKQLDCGSLKNSKFKEQKKYPGTKLITLGELFDFIKDLEEKNPEIKKVFFNIETKIEIDFDTRQDKIEFAQLLTQKIEEYQFSKRSTIQSFDLEVLPIIKKNNPELKTSALFSPGYWKGFWLKMGMLENQRNKIIQKALEYDADIISPHYVYVDENFMQQAAKNELLVIPWTVNDQKIMLKLIRLKTDGLITDYPNRFYELIKIAGQDDCK